MSPGLCLMYFASVLIVDTAPDRGNLREEGLILETFILRFVVDCFAFGIAIGTFVMYLIVSTPTPPPPPVSPPAHTLSPHILFCVKHGFQSVLCARRCRAVPEHGHTGQKRGSSFQQVSLAAGASAQGRSLVGLSPAQLEVDPAWSCADNHGFISA